MDPGQNKLTPGCYDPEAVELLARLLRVAQMMPAAMPQGAVPGVAQAGEAIAMASTPLRRPTQHEPLTIEELVPKSGTGPASVDGEEGKLDEAAGGMPPADTSSTVSSETPSEEAARRLTSEDRWLEVQRALESAFRRSDEAAAGEARALALYERFVDSTPFAREYAGEWVEVVERRRESRAAMEAAQKNCRARQKARKAEEEARALKRVAVREAAMAQKRVEAAEEAEKKAREAQRLAQPLQLRPPRAPAPQAQPPQRGAEPRQPSVQERLSRGQSQQTPPTPAQETPNLANRRCPACGRKGVAKGARCPDWQRHDPRDPWYLRHRP